MPAASLIADIGGTNARFAVAQSGRFDHLRVLPTADYPTMQAAAKEFLAGLPADLPVSRAALDVAGPVSGDVVSLTNGTWSFSIAAARSELGLAELRVFNDFAAAAVGIPHLERADSIPIGGGERVERGPIAVIGPGTGLGVASLVHGSDGWVVAPGEGGHVTMPAATRDESRILDLLRDRWGHVSAERVLSGQGIRNLYEAVCILSGQTSRGLTDHEITEAALAGEDAACEQSLDLFCAMLGTVAGNLAMTLGATGGLFLTGGILPRFADRVVASGFRERFESKGRLSGYLQSIPAYLVVHPNPALVGLASLESLPSGPPRAGRRLSDKILIAFHHACDLRDFDVAEQLLRTLELLVTRRLSESDGDRRRGPENLVAAHERLWQLRHSDAGRQA